MVILNQGQPRPNKPVNEGVYSRDGTNDTGEVVLTLKRVDIIGDDDGSVGKDKKIAQAHEKS